MEVQEKMPKVTQCDRVLIYIRDFGSITALDAMRDLGVMRLAARISDLKRQGYRIDSRSEVVVNRYEERVSIKRYFLV